MKLYKYILTLALAGGAMTACDTDPVAEMIQKPYTYSELYYQNLRDYKASDHSIAWGWFADYTQSHSMALRFMGLPDSLDICSLWGGVPSDVEGRKQTFYAPDVAKEMRFVQQKKGTRMVIPTIIRIEDQVAYGDKEFYTLFQESYDNTSTETEEERLAKRHKALEMYADYLLQPMWENDLDGLDLDYEPEGDKLSGENMVYFVEYLGKFIGPESENPEKLLCIDFYGTRPPADVVPYVSWFVNQTYGGTPSESSAGSFPVEKFVFTENIGDNWQTGGRLKEYAAWQPSMGRKGGFGAFYMHRDYNLTPPYKNFREAIQIQNPAVH